MVIAYGRHARLFKANDATYRRLFLHPVKSRMPARITSPVVLNQWPRASPNTPMQPLNMPAFAAVVLKRNPKYGHVSADSRLQKANSCVALAPKRGTKKP